MATVTVHRDIRLVGMEHVVDGSKCWCDPVVVQEDDLRTTEQIIEEAKVVQN